MIVFDEKDDWSNTRDEGESEEEIVVCTYILPTYDTHGRSF